MQWEWKARAGSGSPHQGEVLRLLPGSPGGSPQEQGPWGSLLLLWTWWERLKQPIWSTAWEERGRDLKSVIVAGNEDSEFIFPMKKYSVALGIKEISERFPGNLSIASNISIGKGALTTWIITYSWAEKCLSKNRFLKIVKFLVRS